MTDESLTRLAKALAKRLEANALQLVLAESCTAGLVSAVLGRVPGISRFLCGSAVVYQLETKTQWLGVPAKMLSDPGPVSAEVARRMAEGVLATTPHADVAASVTGHLGPNAPRAMDGRVYLGLAFPAGRSHGRGGRRPAEVLVKKLELSQEPEDALTPPRRRRLRRQRAAVAHLLKWLIAELDARA